MAARTIRVITHIHSSGSNALACKNHALVTAFVQREFGAAADLVQWSECATSTADLEAILAGRRTRHPVSLLFLTDHMSARRHVIEADVLALAERCHRFGVGAEISTCLSDGEDRWVDAPEILVYGPSPLNATAQPYYGLTQGLLDEIFCACTRPGAPRPDARLLHAFCRKNRLACAMAHPLDGHELPLPSLLTLIRTFDFVETINGGYPHANARLLVRLLGILRRERDEGAGGESSLDTPPALVGLGGSDAHLNHFDRVVTMFRCEDEEPDAGTFLTAMLAAPGNPRAALERFRPTGRGNLGAELAWEILVAIVRNVSRNRHLLGGRRQATAVVGRAVGGAARLLREKSTAGAERRRHLARWLEVARPLEPAAAHTPSVRTVGRRPPSTQRAALPDQP